MQVPRDSLHWRDIIKRKEHSLYLRNLLSNELKGINKEAMQYTPK